MIHRKFSTRALCFLAAAAWCSILSPAAAQPRPVDMPATGASLRITFGLNDKAETPWDGRISLSSGKVVALEVKTPQTGTATGNAWKLRTTVRKPRGQKSVHDPKLKKFIAPVLVATLDAPAGATVSIGTKQGDFSLTLDAVQPGTPQMFLDGRVRLELVPMSIRLTTGPDDEDLPAAAKDADGNVWVVYTAYKHAQALDIEAIHGQRNFDTLVSEGHGDQVRLMKFDGRQWSTPTAVTEGGLDVWRPTVAVDGKGMVHVVWSQTVDGNWDLYTRRFDPAADRWTKASRLTEAPGADVYPAAATDPTTGTVYVAWQGWRGDNFDILLTTLDGDRVTSEKTLAGSPANEWCPVATFDSKGSLHVAFDTYEKGNYDVKLVSAANRSNPRTVTVAGSPRYEARPSIAVDGTDRVWVAFEDGDPNWGKDSGMRWRGSRGALLYFRREITLRCVEGDRVRQAKGIVPADAIKRNYPPAQTRRLSLPRLCIDADDRVWLLLRQAPTIGGGGEVWAGFVTHHQGDGWATPVQLANSMNLLDNRPAMIPLVGGGILTVHSTDGRINNTQSAKQNDLYCTVTRAGGDATAPELVELPQVDDTIKPTHPNETEDLRRIHAYRPEIGDKTYQLLRGEFHRHTELTSHRDQDGTLEEMWRYALDAAAMDWIGNGDHDNGYGVEYLWWIVQKQTDLFHHPSDFTPMFTYERSVSYPSGHRNAMFAVRGIRPLPRIGGGKERLFGTPEAGSPDIKTFYAYLKHFNGICASHTSGTNMGTDWRDNDPDVEPIVEIYQGLRHSYEHAGAPGSAKGTGDAIGGYRPAGFVWKALQKGYRLGFQSSSDHYSTHTSYAVVYAEDRSREAILDAFKRRHCYGANDNIILDVRCGEQMMGDVFTLKGKPKLDITVIGTAPIARLSIIRGVGDDVPRYVYDTEPNKQEVKLQWTDEAPQWGKTAYYYVRIEQVRPKEGYGALAWASPMWIDPEK